MVKKRIEDLLREEAQKPIEPEDDTVLDVTAEEIIESDAATDAGANSSRRTNPTKADLETTVKELRAAVQGYGEENSSLEQQNASLQSDLQKHKALVEKLQAELEEAKKVILQLTESNSKPAQSTSLAARPAPMPGRPAPMPAQSTPLPGRPAPMPAQSTPLPGRPAPLAARNTSLSRIPHHSMQHESPSTAFTDTDIGWVD